jgi:CRISPR-associated protein Cmr6
MKMRLVSQEIQNSLESNKDAPANFGLLFNKWLDFDGCEPTVKRNKQPLIDSYGKSLKRAEEILKQRHIQQAGYCRAMEQAGWRSFIVHARLTSPFVSGLGMTHPTEAGMVLDHTSGLPYIPAASQKGVLRLAHVINSLIDNDGNWRELDELLEQGIVKKEHNRETREIDICWQEDSASQTLFGAGGEKNSLAGQLVVLDAYPLSSPALGEEILNPHFMKYYGGERGPTEDQSPIPVKFLVVKQDADFVFRMLLRCPFNDALEKNQEKLVELIERNLRRAISEEGIGAKTTLGFGRFEIISTDEPETIVGWIRNQKEREEETRYPWRPTLRKIEQVNDWGQLKQLLANKDTQIFQTRAELGQVIQKAAFRIREANPRKWDDERDKLIADWLKFTNLLWESRVVVGKPVGDPLSPEEQAAIDQIEKLTDWGAWKNAGIAMESLPLPVLKKLKEKFSAWKIKNGKGDKPAVWKTLNQLVRQGERGQ